MASMSPGPRPRRRPSDAMTCRRRARWKSSWESWVGKPVSSRGTLQGIQDGEDARQPTPTNGGRPSADPDRSLAGQKGLKDGAVGFVSSVVIGVASTAPGYSLAASLGLVVAVAGVGPQQLIDNSDAQRQGLP